ncbi:Dehydrogenase E1 component [Penicillium vulpinum]|uniref:Nudix hydrolase domain-containing protein n=1 Tax=Penicillium vulpinum TaxID=29845 RepID=A0A1V6S206_9EURO|nr:Dehydrogenase E1 component [Penicillium vulpinum]KAJ5959445.1 Dehydrogenase E1 component [Penicillium vulpinum]OQE08077.1 hypothetical protein PENVUL_c011G01882 [Penicillium vulpinum]
MASQSMYTRVADLDPDNHWFVSVAVCRYQANEQFTVLALKIALREAMDEWWSLPTGPVLDTDVTIADAVRRIVREKTGLGLQVHHNIQQIESSWWSFQNRTHGQLNFMIYDTSAEPVTIHSNEFLGYEWAGEERFTSVNIPLKISDLVQTAFALHSFGVV